MIPFFKVGLSKAKKIDWAIIGLGNPEEKYLLNRHNIGAMVAIDLAKHFKKERFSRSHNFYETTIQSAGQSILIALPTTYMNNSGKAVKRIMSKYSIAADNIIVILDEYNFPLGKIHLRKNGGDGGHNGIISIIEEIGTNQFFRLRCGIGKDFEQGEMANYVLSDFKQGEIELRNKMINDAVKSLIHLFKVTVPRGMSDINSGKIFANEEN